ncbi:precorrin-6A reductase [Granulicatella sp. zg-ZJ]|uniref:precorrin-6A reductase n=1 Tax=unclassified Granulicatella TaxID=2630493 RepID=UPI0013C09787|nr:MULTISPECIES: precorrin-6A reductase [unclassified Granulicatella]MBS4749711.1 precorrin-6A reductase [Carnobacteriaceae bacterium zg-ZUI78]NEW61840.1 precorrin-6A reductase [Granulicatella sp. zg-ZJ]NEW65914.1 precorrin-6A reductase [Granulicatella sp. zg-84]QMI85143.1 precorrin-6A reductase [Carnobacteriaceae bacterium zg-84]
MMKLLFGGTSDSTAILGLLNELNISVTTSVVTDYGKHLASKYGQPVIQGRLTAEDMVSFIKENNVDEIIDSTHPFADIVSREAMRAAEMAGVKYMRFERVATSDLSGAIVVYSTQEAIEVIKDLGHVVYLGTGSKTLPLFVDGLPDKRIIARVLPTSEVLLACEKIGMVADQIDAIKAPFTKECNKELLKRANANVFVTKESGDVGGVRDKIDACLELGIDCVVISRPKVEYPAMVSTIDELRDYLVKQ